MEDPLLLINPDVDASYTPITRDPGLIGSSRAPLPRLRDDSGTGPVESGARLENAPVVVESKGPGFEVLGPVRARLIYWFTWLLLLVDGGI